MHQKYLKKGMLLVRRFGFKHTLKRVNDCFMQYVENKRKNFLYCFHKKKDVVCLNVLDFCLYVNTKDKGIHRDLYLDGIREPTATSYMLNNIRPDDVVLEVGANIGYYAVMLAKRCKFVHAVEPVLSNIDYLRKNIDLNHLKNLKVYDCALGNKNEDVRIGLSSKSNWHSFCLDTKGGSSQGVRLVKGDTLFRTKKKPSVVRMDVEGYELEVLKGLVRLLDHVRLVFYFFCFECEWCLVD